MEYKLNLITPSIYSQEGKDNCIDHNVEEFASYVKDRADNEFLLPCKYERVPGSAYIHSFEDFEKRFLIHSEYAVIIASPLSQKALSRFIPRLLVFLTSKPIWQNRFLFVLLGEVTVLSNLVVNDPIQFSTKDWETKDEQSWITLFNLIKITWKPHIDEHTIPSKAIEDSSQISSLNEHTNINDVQDPTVQFKQSAEVKSSATRATQGSIVTVESFHFISDDQQNSFKSYNDSDTNTDITLSPYQEWEENETNDRRIKSNNEFDNKRADFECSISPTDYQKDENVNQNAVKRKSYESKYEDIPGKLSGLSLMSTDIEPSQTNTYDSNLHSNVNFEGKNMKFDENFKVYSETRATQGSDVTVEDIIIINKDVKIVKNQLRNESETNTDFSPFTTQYSNENKCAISGAALLKLNRDLALVESNYDTDNESEGTFECVPHHPNVNDDDDLNENDFETSKGHGLYLIKECDDPATRNLNQKNKEYITEFGENNLPTINSQLSTEEMKKLLSQSKLNNPDSCFSNNDGDLHDLEFSHNNDFSLPNPIENVLINSDASIHKNEIAHKQYYDIPQIALQEEFLVKDRSTIEKGSLKYLNLKDLTDEINSEGDKINENTRTPPDLDSNFLSSIKSDEHPSSKISDSQNVSEFDFTNKDHENLETNTNSDESLDNTLEYSDLVIGNLAESNTINTMSLKRSKLESNIARNIPETIDENDYEQTHFNLDSHFNRYGTVTPYNASSDSLKITHLDDKSASIKDEFTTEMNIETESKTLYLSSPDDDVSKIDAHQRREGEMIRHEVDEISKMESEGRTISITGMPVERQTREHNNEVGDVIDKAADLILDENVYSISHISDINKNRNDDNIDLKFVGTSFDIDNISPEYLEERGGSKEIKSGFQSNIEKNICEDTNTVTEQEWEDDSTLYLEKPSVINLDEIESREIINLEEDEKEKSIEIVNAVSDDNNLRENLNKEDLPVKYITGSLYNKLTSEDNQSGYLKLREEIKAPTEVDEDRDKYKGKFQIGDKILESNMLQEDRNANRNSDTHLIDREDLSSNVFDYNKSPSSDNINFITVNTKKSDKSSFSKETDDFEMTDEQENCEDLENTIAYEVDETFYPNLSKNNEELINVDEEYSDTNINDNIKEELEKERKLNEENNKNPQFSERKINIGDAETDYKKNEDFENDRQKNTKDSIEIKNVNIAGDREFEIKDPGKETILDVNFVDPQLDIASKDNKLVNLDISASFIDRSLNTKFVESKVKRSKETKYECEASYSADLKDNSEKRDGFKNEMESKSESIFDDSNLSNETRDNSFIPSSPIEEFYVESNENSRYYQSGNDNYDKSKLEIIDTTSHKNYNPFSFLSRFHLTRFYFWRNFFVHNPQISPESDEQLLISERKSISEYLRSPYCVLLLFVAGTLLSPYWVAITKKIGESPAAPEIITETILSTVVHEEDVNRKYSILPVKHIRSLGVNSSSKLMLNPDD